MTINQENADNLQDKLPDFNFYGEITFYSVRPLGL